MPSVLRTLRRVFWLMLSLVARCAQPKRKMSFFCGSAIYALNKIASPFCNSVFVAMLFWTNKHKIARAVILSVSVYMMYMHPLWRICYNAMLVLPFARFGNFYQHIGEAVTSRMQTSATDRTFYANLAKYAQTYFTNFRRNRFICTVWAAGSIMVSVPITTLASKYRSTTKRAWLRGEFFHTYSLCQAH